MTIVNIDESIFLETFEEFQICLLPAINAGRVRDGEDELTPDQETNMFLELRAKFKIK